MEIQNSLNILKWKCLGMTDVLKILKILTILKRNYLGMTDCGTIF